MAFKTKILVLLVTSFVATGAIAKSQPSADLIQVYEQALQSSPEYKANFYTMQSTKAGQSISLGALLPNIALSATAEQNYLQYQGLSTQTFRNYGATINLTQTLFDYNAYQSYEASKKTSLQAQATYKGQKQQFILDFASAYFNVLNAKEQLSFSKANLKAVKSALDQSQQKLDVGMATEVDVKTSQANYYSALAQVTSAENTLKTAYASLYQYTGIEYQNLADLYKDLHFTLPEPDNIHYWVEQGQQNNPNIWSNIYQQQAAENTIQAATGSLLPTVSLEAQYNVNDYKGSTTGLALASLTPGNVRGGYIGLDFSWNILNGGSDYATRKQAAFDYQAAQFNTLDQRRTIKQNIQNDFYNVVSEVKQIQALKQAVVAAQYAYNQYEARFKVGNATITDVLNQLQKLYQSQSNLAQAKYDYIVNVLQLKLDAGTLSEKDINIFNTWLDH
ncbi:TolC family outer membrane protein [Facilibium subflavum]|uniref:TolC family outer membrane protein n=1 Tax=Facilibium subflavum TaxID=2219058 RepID=UPI000E658249|nr:TolC family outer membrane protein [Facilibium subflavum]